MGQAEKPQREAKNNEIQEDQLFLFHTTAKSDTQRKMWLVFNSGEMLTKRVSKWILWCRRSKLISEALPPIPEAWQLSADLYYLCKLCSQKMKNQPTPSQLRRRDWKATWSDDESLNGMFRAQMSGIWIVLNLMLLSNKNLSEKVKESRQRFDSGYCFPLWLLFSFCSFTFLTCIKVMKLQINLLVNVNSYIQ